MEDKKPSTKKKIVQKDNFEEIEVRKKAEDLEKTQSALMNILEDVEEARKKAEEEKNKTSAVITNFTDGLLFFDKEKKLSLINPRAISYLEVKQEETLGKTFTEFSQLPAFSSIALALGSDIQDLFRREVALRDDLVLEVSAIPIKLENEISGSLVVLHDITREKTVERMKSEFVSIAAHQLRTPLSAIKWTMRMLLDGDLGQISPEQKELVEKTYLSNERMIALINDLLDVTRIEEGRYIYKPALTDLGSVIQFVINSCKENAQIRQVKIEFQKPEKLPKVLVDVEKIKLAIQNYFDNALKYTPKGGIISISLKVVGKEIEFSIKDTGVGIPKDQQERIYTKFFRGANVVRMDTDGNGLGLFIVKNIIEAHGGRVWFESEEGKGSTFYFALPIKEEFEGLLREL